MSSPIFLEYNSQEQEQKLVDLFEQETGRSLYPAQDERLMISIIEYKASLLVNMFNEAAKLNLTQYSRGMILDCIGEMFTTPRLKGEKGIDSLKITLNTTFSHDLTISKGLKVISKDEKFVFETVEDLVIPSGETEGTVTIMSADLTEEVNNYRAGDINILVKPVSYIQSVENLNGVTGAAGEEKDEPYIKRILLAPEKFSCAGSRQSYIYHTLSANTKIIDAAVESVEHQPSITISANETATEYVTDAENVITTPDFTAQVDKSTGEFTFSLNNKEYKFKMPFDNEINVYPLTMEDTTSTAILTEVETLLNGDSINPMTDKVKAFSPEKIEKTINLNVILEKDSDLETVEKLVNDACEKYKNEMRGLLNTEIVPSQIIAQVGAIEGVYSADTGNLTNTVANINQYFDITFELTISQKGE